MLGGRGPTRLLAAYWTRADDEMWFPRSELSNFPLHLRGNRAAWEQGKWASGGGGGAGGGHGYREVCLNNSMSQAFKKRKERKRKVMIKCSIFWKQFVLIIHFKFLVSNSQTNQSFVCFFLVRGPSCYNIARHSVPFRPELVSNSTTEESSNIIILKKNCEVSPSHFLSFCFFFFFFNHSVVILENGPPSRLHSAPSWPLEWLRLRAQHPLARTQPIQCGQGSDRQSRCRGSRGASITGVKLLY